MKNKKLLIGAVIFLIIGFLSGFIISKGVFQFFSKESEKNYKTGSLEPRYLKEFQKPPLNIPKVKTEKLDIGEEQESELKEALNNAAQNAKEFPWFDDIKNEHVFLAVKDLGNLPFTLSIDEGSYSIKEGFDKSQDPTMVLSMEARNIRTLEEVFKDKKLAYEEKYILYNALTIPALQTLYRTDTLYTPGDKSKLKFDDLVHITIPPQKPVKYKGELLSIKATAANVDGQWLVFPGLQGDPDWKISLDLDEATKLYTMGVYKVREAGNNPAKLLEVSNQFLDFMEDKKVYIREDHK